MSEDGSVNDRQRDDYTPRERGLLIGSDWAQSTREHGGSAVDDKGNPIDPLRAAAAETPYIAPTLREEIMAAGMRERLDASESADADAAFWSGFRDGVRAYLVRMETGQGEN
jgi:hypothetical protein